MNRSRSLRPAARRAALVATLAAATLLAGCAATRVETTGSALKEPLCEAGKPPVTTQVFWGAAWRPDQKEPALREAAALRGIQDFLTHAGCLSAVDVTRLANDQPPPSDEELLRRTSGSKPAPQRVLLVVVRELGPRLHVGIPVLVAGETEVVVDVRVIDAPASRPLAAMQTRWRHGGSFVIKGTGTLDQDMAAALRHSLLRPDPHRE